MPSRHTAEAPAGYVGLAGAALLVGFFAGFLVGRGTFGVFGRCTRWVGDGVGAGAGVLDAGVAAEEAAAGESLTEAVGPAPAAPWESQPARAATEKSIAARTRRRIGNLQNLGFLEDAHERRKGHEAPT